MPESLIFHRPRLAEQISKVLLDNAVGSATASGLFLAAGRRTGKSTFLREDLRPQLEKMGALVLYVDLWADKRIDPGDAIVQAVREAVNDRDGIVTKLAKQTGLEKLAMGGLAFSLDRVGLGKDVSLSAALSCLSDDLRCPVVLLLDEAQHAVTTEKGYDALHALKAARDELNSSRHYGLRIVATGSNQDKLAMLRSSKDQAFYGAPLRPMPPLDFEYIRWFCAGVNLPAALDPYRVEPLFKDAGYRPEVLGAAADEVRLSFELDPKDVPQAFEHAVKKQISQTNEQVLRVLHSLTALQSAVLRVMAARGSDYAPFEDETMRAYEITKKAFSPADAQLPDSSNVQAALLALQEKALIWRERRGVYALEEASVGDLMASQGWLDAVPKLADDGYEP